LSLGLKSENNSFRIEDWTLGVQNVKTLFSANLDGNIGIGTADPTEKLDVNGITKSKSLTLNGFNPINSVNNFYNKIEFTGQANSAIVYKPGTAKELMFGMHDNGRFYWGTGRSATKPDFYSMWLNGNTGELSSSSIYLRSNKIVDGWRQTNFNWFGHSLIFGTKPGAYAHNVIEIKPGGASQGQLLSSFRMHHAKSQTEHELRVNIDSRKTSPTYFNVGNIGIGTTTPIAKLSIKSTATSGAGEKLLDFTVSDTPDYLRLVNATQANGHFIPSFSSYKSSDNKSALYFTASTNTANDTGVVPLMVFDSRISTKAIVNRPLFS